MSSPTAAFPDWLASRAASSPDRDALVTDGRTWSFRELDEQVTRTAHHLVALGARPGDRVATLLHNGLAAVLLPHALLRLGATLVPLNVRLGDSELAWQLADAAPRLLVTEERTVARAERAAESLSGRVTVCTDRALVGPATPPPARDGDRARLRLRHAADAVLAMIYTSGTTGRPKGALLTVGNFWWSAIGSALNLGTHADDRWLVCLPLFHVGGLSILTRAAIYGITAVVHDGFDPDAVSAAVDDERITVVSVVATMLQRMLDARGGRPWPASLRCVLLGGGPAPRPLLERCASLGVPVVQTYGLTETCSQVATLAPGDALLRSGSAGKVLYPNELRVAAPPGTGASDDAGEILVRGPVVMAGYAGRPEDTARAIVDGWLHTGDIGRLDADGYLYVLDRRDDLIVTGGENVYPAEVEAVLLSHPSIAEVGVVGIGDETWGQRVVAVARLGDATAILDGASLEALCRSRLAGYKVPREFRLVVEPLPRTASGKLRRGALRDLLAGRS
ncbi:MAG TPA: o-succinylbenzoate--CoA ligase [Gemmatimonadaceae bacterium]|nr:o-succinylbenzoate--CoA ligase [Gemmatimonadaceae bacterium]